MRWEQSLVRETSPNSRHNTMVFRRFEQATYQINIFLILASELLTPSIIETLNNFINIFNHLLLQPIEDKWRVETRVQSSCPVSERGSTAGYNTSKQQQSVLYLVQPRIINVNVLINILDATDTPPYGY